MRAAGPLEGHSLMLPPPLHGEGSKGAREWLSEWADTFLVGRVRLTVYEFVSQFVLGS